MCCGFLVVLAFNQPNSPETEITYLSLFINVKTNIHAFVCINILTFCYFINYVWVLADVAVLKHLIICLSVYYMALYISLSLSYLLLYLSNPHNIQLIKIKYYNICLHSCHKITYLLRYQFFILILCI